MKLLESLRFELLLAPEWLWAGPLWLLALGLARFLAGRPPALPIGAPAGDLGPLARRFPPLRNGLGALCLAASALCLLIALALPARRRLETLERSGLDIVLCIDVSSSMTATDLDGERTRLAVARETAARFIRERPQDRIGLVAFARYDDLLAPPTEDHRGLVRLLTELAPVEAEGPEDATGFGGALARAAETLGRGLGRARLVVLLTDGEENVATAGEADAILPDEAAQLARALEVRVYAISIGSGQTVGIDGRSRPIDTGPLKRVAERTGGLFFAAANAQTLQGVYAAIALLEDRRAPELSVRFEPQPWAWIALGALLALLGFSGARWRGALWP